MSTTPKEIIFEEAAREKLAQGIKNLAEIVAFTLGPKGRNVGLEKSWGAPSITSDGNNIIKDIVLKDQYENMGVSMAKEVAQNIKDRCGDGTTTGTLLLNALVEHGLKFIASGASPISVKRGMDKAVEAVIAEVEKKAIPVKGNNEIKNIATVSASGNTRIGENIAKAMESVGESGVITIEESKGTTTTIDIVEGMEFDRGYLSPYFCTNVEKMIVEMANAYILLTDKKISNIHDILPILQTVAASGKELLIIAEDIEGDALSTLVVNKIRGTIKATAVKAPGFGDKRKAMLEDLAVLTGGTLFTEEVGMALKDATVEQLGSAEKITINKEKTIIINGGGKDEAIKARIKLIENAIKAESGNASKYDKEKLQERKAKLSGGVAVIRVGATTEPELKKKKQDYEDSLSSTKAAIEEGIVPGGGVALLRAQHVIDSLNLQNDELFGGDIVKKACEVSLKQIVNNAGFDGAVVLIDVKREKENFGFNALTDKIEDLVKAGVVDPVKVVKTCLTNAASVAGIVLISEALISEAEGEETAI